MKTKPDTIKALRYVIDEAEGDAVIAVGDHLFYRQPVVNNLLDDAERCAELEARVEDLEAGAESWREQSSRLVGECNQKDARIKQLEQQIRRRIATAIQEAEAAGLYEISEHLTSQVMLDAMTEDQDAD